MEERRNFHNRYFLKQLLGRGNFSEVWLATDTKTDVDVAIKIYAPAAGLDDDGLNIFAREFAIVVNATQKNLLTPLHYDTCDRKPYLVLPFCSHGSVKKRIGLFKESEIWKLLHDVASGLDFLHSMNPPVIHQDIKPDNIMQNDNGDYMLTDFGVSSHCRSVLRKTVSEAFSSAGTMAYMAPERFGKNGNSPIMASDIYSLGTTAFELLTGDVPFGNNGGLIQKKGADIPELPEKYSLSLRKVITQCLDKEPWKRPTANQLAGYAAHGMKGEHFLLAGEKSFIQKYWPVLAGICLIVSCLISWGVSQIKKSEEEKRIKIQHQMEIARKDSINTLILKYIENGDTCYNIAKSKDEKYDEKLIMAKDEYRKALEEVNREKSGVFNGYVTNIVNHITEIDSCLKIALQEMKFKASFFEEDPTIKAEFEKRANNITNSLNRK